MIDADEIAALLAAGTARPWSVRTDGRSGDHPRVMGVYGPPRTVDHGLGPERDDERIIETDGGYYEPEYPDAALIVTAVNSLEPLLAIYQAAIKIQRGCDCGYDYRCGKCQAVVDLHEALDRAKGTP